MGYERRIMRTILSFLIVLASLVTVYGDRDNNFMKLRTRVVSSPVIQKWREAQMGAKTADDNTANGQWREELLSNLRNVLRKHNQSPSSQRDATDITSYGLQDQSMALPAEAEPDHLFLLDGGATAPRDSTSYVDREDKRNGFFFGKRNGFFFGKRSGNDATAMVDEDRMLLPKYEASSFDKCRPCGPAAQGRCVMLGTCCSPQFGCYIFTPETAACMTVDLPTCQLEAPSCGRGGQCVANGVCCSATEGFCQLEPACTSMVLN